SMPISDGRGVSEVSLRVTIGDFSKTRSYKTGSKNNVRTVEVNSPPITTEARGRWTSAPVDVDTAIGRKPKLATHAVINTGLNLRLAPSTTASYVFSPWRRN